jgi:hypothetical protein
MVERCFNRLMQVWAADPLPAAATVVTASLLI